MILCSIKSDQNDNSRRKPSNKNLSNAKALVLLALRDALKFE
jgi:hypothetical protein